MCHKVPPIHVTDEETEAERSDLPKAVTKEVVPLRISLAEPGKRVTRLLQCFYLLHTCPLWTRPQPFKVLTLSSSLLCCAALDLKMIALLCPCSPILTPGKPISCDSSSKVTMHPCDDNVTR